MNRVFHLSSADGGGKWEHRPDQYGTSLMMTHPDVKEFCCVKGTQEGMSQQGGAAAIQDAMDGSSVVYYMPNDTKAREQTTKIFNHWIDSVDEVNAEFLYDKAGHKGPGNDLNKKPFIDATLYSLGAGSASNTASITVQKGYIDEPDRINQSVGGEGGIIGLLSGRFGSIPSGKLSVFGSPTSKNGRIWKYLSTFKHVFECYWPCPECKKMQTADWGGLKSPYGFKWDLVYEKDGETLDIERTSETAHYICNNENCKARITENQFRDQLYQCEYFSKTGLWFDIKESDGHGEFKERHGDEWRLIKAPAKVAARKTKDGIGLYSMSTWAEGARLWLEAVNYYHVTGDTDELLKPRVNTYRGYIWESVSQSEVKADVVLSHRSDFYDNRKLPDCIEWLGMEVDFQKRFCKYMLTGYAKNGKKTDIYGFVCKPIQGRTADPDAEFWEKLSEIATAEYEREDGTMLRIGRVIADAGHHPETVIKWCSEDPDHRIAVFGRPGSKGGLPRVMFDYSDKNPDETWKVYTVGGEEYGAHGVPIHPHKASSRAYARLSNTPGKPGCFIFASTDDFNQDFADEATADKHSRKKASNGEYYDHYEKETDSTQNEAHDLIKYSEIVLHILDKFGPVVPKEIAKKSAVKQIPTQTTNFDPFGFV